MAQSGVNLSGVGVSLVPGGSSSITINTTTITGGADTQVLFNDGGFVGSSTGLTFTKGNGGTTSILSVGVGTGTVVSAKFAPASDSTTAMQFTKADGVTVIGNWDSTNGRLGIGTAAPATLLHAFSSTANITIRSESTLTTGLAAFTAQGESSNAFTALSQNNSATANTALNTLQLAGIIRSGTSNTGGLAIIAAANAPIILATGGSALVNERMRILGSAASFTFGGPDAAAPGVVTFSMQNVVAGNANTAAANTTFTGSLSNGSGAGGDLIFQTTGSVAASGSQNTALTALTIKGGTQLVTFAGATSIAGSETFTVAASGPILKQGANGRCGTFVANGVTPVTVNNTSVAITDSIIISLNTIGGTVGVQPHVATITDATSFTVVCTAVDSSTYNYAIIKNAA